MEEADVWLISQRNIVQGRNLTSITAGGGEGDLSGISKPGGSSKGSSNMIVWCILE